MEFRFDDAGGRVTAVATGKRFLGRRGRRGGPLAPVLAISALFGIALVLLAFSAFAWAGSSYTTEELTVLSLINDYREANGLIPLLLSDTISDACTKHNLDMAHYGFEGHTTVASDYFPEGSWFPARMRISGYDYNTYKGEIVGCGYDSAQGVFEGWKNSPDHNAAMLGTEYRVAGVSMDEVPGSSYTYYWTIDFGGFVDSSAHEPGASSSTTTSTTADAPTTTTTASSTTTTTSPPSTTSTTTTAPPPPQFTDLSATSRFYYEITSLAAASIVSGYADDSFRPNDPVTRAQFAKIVMLAIGSHTEKVEGIGSAMFRDVSYAGQPYPFDFVQEAAGLGIIKGHADGTFGPYQNLSRVQLALMLVRAGGAALTEPPADFKLPFADVPAYARKAVAVASHNQLLSGKTDTTFDPYDVASRGQVAKTVYQLMERLGS